VNLDDAPESSNVEDSRGMGSKLAIGGGAGLVLAVLGLIFGVNFGGNGPAPGPGPGQHGPNHAAPDDGTLEFTKKVLGTTEVVWADKFQRMGKSYEPPKLDLFTAQVHTKCGTAPAAVGPFYCPADRTVYIDPSFFDELQDKLGGSKADFSKAYVIAHEVGHHVQNLLGISERGNPKDKDFSVRLELQADYLAGVWAHRGQEKFHFVQPGDIESALTTARAIGDDRLQKRSGGFVHPESFTHGTSAQRVAAFDDGFRTGDASKEKLDTFFTARSSQDLYRSSR
jgi:predicted metalloprotease